MKIFTILFITLLITYACDENTVSDKKHTTDEPKRNQTLEGSWNLDNVYGGIQGINLNYNSTEVIWSFSTNSKSLEVKNNIITTGPKSTYAGFQTGKYSYDIRTEHNQSVLYVNDQRLAVFSFKNNNLNLNHGLEVDGYMKVFTPKIITRN